MDKINVLQISNQLGVGGTEKCLEIFTRLLDKDIFNVYVCGIQEGGIRERMLKEDGFDVSVVSRDYDKLLRLMRDKKIEVVHIHRGGQSEPLPLQAAKRANVPVIVETNVFGQYDNSESGRLIDLHLLVSKTISLRYIRSAGISLDRFLNKCRVVYNPINLEEFEKHKASQKQTDKLISEIGVDKNTPLICRVGRADLVKWDVFPVDMMSYLVRKLPDVRYLIIGGIPKPVKMKVAELGLEENFIETGFVSEEMLIQTYCSIDILAHSSRVGESFGYTIAEAMVAGRPIVVNSTPWIDNAQIELVDNGKTGFVTTTPRTFANAVAYLIENGKEAKKMGLAGKEKAEKQYDARKTTRILEKIYLGLLSRKGKSGIQGLIDQYNEVQYFPTDSDILNYPEEYKKRLNQCFGKSNPIEELRYRSKWIYEWLLNLRRHS